MLYLSLSPTDFKLRLEAGHQVLGGLQLSPQLLHGLRSRAQLRLGPEAQVAGGLGLCQTHVHFLGFWLPIAGSCQGCEGGARG